MLRNSKWIGPATTVVGLFMSAAAAHAAPNGWSNFYVSVMGGVAIGSGGTSATATEYEDPDPECSIFVDDYCLLELDRADGSVGSGIAGGVAIGTTIAPNTRVEIEGSMTHLNTTTKWSETETWDPESPFGSPFSFNGTTHGDLNAAFLFGNIWYDIPLGQVTPYVGGGVGIAHVSGVFGAPIDGDPATDLTLAVSGFVPAVQIGTGLTFQVAPKITLDVGYRLKALFGVPVGKGPNFESEVENFPGDEISGYEFGQSTSIFAHVFQVGVTFSID